MKRRTFLTSVAALPLSFGFTSLARAGGALAGGVPATMLVAILV